MKLSLLKKINNSKKMKVSLAKGEAFSKRVHSTRLLEKEIFR